MVLLWGTLLGFLAPGSQAPGSVHDRSALDCSAVPGKGPDTPKPHTRPEPQAVETRHSGVSVPRCSASPLFPVGERTSLGPSSESSGCPPLLLPLSAPLWAQRCVRERFLNTGRSRERLRQRLPSPPVVPALRFITPAPGSAGRESPALLSAIRLTKKPSCQVAVSSFGSR